LQIKTIVETKNTSTITRK